MFRRETGGGGSVELRRERKVERAGVVRRGIDGDGEACGEVLVWVLVLVLVREGIRSRRVEGRGGDASEGGS
jgi:hypothetical protein